MYSLSLSLRTIKRLKFIHSRDQRKVLNKLKVLEVNPKESSLNIKKLTQTQYGFRLRVDKIRVIFDVDHKLGKIYILDIDYKGNIY